MAVLEAAKNGNLEKIKKLLTPENVNCRDSKGRNSTPLHLAGRCCIFWNYLKYIQNPFFIAGYNQQEVAEYLLLNGAEVNAQDKGGTLFYKFGVFIKNNYCF